MKKNKIGLGLLIGLVILTGCTNNVKTKVCVEETNENGMKSVDTVTLTYNKYSVLKASGLTVTEASKAYADMAYNIIEPSFKKFSEIDGIKMSITRESDTKIKVETSVDFVKVDVEKVKELLGENYDQSKANFYNAKNISVDQFIKDNLEGYDCK